MPKIEEQRTSISTQTTTVESTPLEQNKPIVPGRIVVEDSGAPSDLHGLKAPHADELGKSAGQQLGVRKKPQKRPGKRTSKLKERKSEWFRKAVMKHAVRAAFKQLHTDVTAQLQGGADPKTAFAGIREGLSDAMRLAKIPKGQVETELNAMAETGFDVALIDALQAGRVSFEIANRELDRVSRGIEQDMDANVAKHAIVGFTDTAQLIAWALGKSNGDFRYEASGRAHNSLMAFASALHRRAGT